MSIYAIQKQAAPPSGISHCISARLTPSCLLSLHDHEQEDREPSTSSRARITRNLVTARSNCLQIFEVVEELRDGFTATAAGSVGSGLVNGESSKIKQELDHLESLQQDTNGTLDFADNNAAARLRFVREHRLHGTITGVQRIQTIDTAQNGLDRLLISFTDAKVSLLEWSPDCHDLVDISLHTFEKLPQIVQGDLEGYKPILRTDPMSRCSALLLPQDTLAITPFFQDQIELEGNEDANMNSLPYAPSFVLELLQINPQLKNVIDFVFLAGFNEPTMAVLTQPVQTWSGRLDFAKDTVELFLITLDVLSSPPSSTIISTTASLPCDSLYLTPCPRDLGGVMVTTPNAILHIDQAGKKTGLALNGFANAMTDMSKTEVAAEGPLSLEGSKLLFVMAEVAILFLQSGQTRAIRVQRDGRTISKLVLLPDHLGQHVPASDLELVRSHLSPRAADGTTQACYAFLASIVGDSQLIRFDFRNIIDEQVNGMGTMEAKEEEANDSIEEDDIDIYGSADAKAEALSADKAARIAASTRLLLAASECQRLPAYGPIRSATLGLVEGDAPQELVACTGDAQSGGLTILHRSILPSKRRRLNLDHATESVWTMRIKQTEGELEYKTYLFTSSDGETQIYTLDNDIAEPDYVKTYAKTTLAAFSCLDDSAIVYVLASAIVLLSGGLSERQKLILPEDAKAKSATMAGQYLLVHLEDADSLLYAFSDTDRLLPVDIPSQIRDRRKTCLYRDTSRTFPPRKRRRRPAPAAQQTGTSTAANAMDIVNNNDDDIYGEPSTSTSMAPPSAAFEVPLTNGHTTPPQDETEPKKPPIWYCTCSDRGGMAIYTLPNWDLVFRCPELLTAPSILEDTRQEAKDDDDEEMEFPEDSSIEHFLLADVGRSRKRVHLTTLTDDGNMVVYEAVPDYGYTAYTDSGSADMALGLRWIKCHSQTLGAARAAKAKIDDDGLGPAGRRLMPFSDFGGGSGILVTGDAPLWLVAEDTSASRIIDCAFKPLYGFTTIAAEHGPLTGIFSLGEEVYSAEMPENMHFSSEIPFTKVIENRLFTEVTYHAHSESYVAIATYDAPFEIFTDEGEPIYSESDPMRQTPTGTRSTLELIEPGSWQTIDGYEFQQYETALCLASMPLESKSVTSGYKDFIAVGTIITRGEDLATRGALYVFGVVEGEPGRNDAAPRRNLRLLFSEELKSAVTSVASLNGHLMHSVGLKMYIKAFDQDERLLSVGFLDIGMYTMCMRSLKNLVLVGDATQGLNFIAFQEDPYKVVSLGKTVKGHPAVTADFLVLENKSAFVATDTSGIIRLYEYDPMRVETQAGQRLLARIEYRYGAEATCSMPFARPVIGGDVKQNGLLFLHVDGSISTIVPVRDAVYKRLQLLERQLVRHTHHFAGLNPRAFRTVRNDELPRPLTKGLLDGDLLNTYSMLSWQKQQQLADPLGSDSDTINYNLRSLKAPW